MKAVDIISHLPIDLWSRIELVSILIGEKPATILYIRVDESEERQTRLREIVSGIEEAGLLLKLGLRETFHPGGYIESYDRIPIFVAGIDSVLHAIVKASTDEDLGRLYGFPETAINAFVGKEGYTKFLMPLIMQLTGPDHYIFLDFVLSAENWREEAEQVRKVFEAVKLAAPDLINTYVRVLRESDVEEWTNVSTGEKVGVLRLKK